MTAREIPMHDLPENFTSAYIVDQYDLRFDGGDKHNGSLYVCTPRGSAGPVSLLADLRAAGLWSAEPEKQVAEDQRQAYKDGLEFVAAAVFELDDGHVLLARFDHPKFPSDADRWAQWLAQVGKRHARLR